MTRLQCGRLLFCLLIVLTAASHAWPQTPSVDPPSLVGKWSGAWVNANTGKGNGKYYLTIERVDGEKVFGTREISGRTESEAKVSGRLSGNQLTFGKTSLTIDGNRMQGTGDRINITLTKE